MAARRSSMRVQSLLLNKDMFTHRQAQLWAHHHGFKSSHVDSGTNDWHVRQQLPTGRIIRTITFAPGIRAIVQRNPAFFHALGRGLSAGYHLYRAERLEKKAKRHRSKATLNPGIVGRIPGHALEIRYQRTGRNAGPYKHPFEHHVRMYAMRDGSVLLKGSKRIHADDREKDFDQYVHRSHRRRIRRNPMARDRMENTGWWLLGGLALIYFLKGGFGLGTSATTVWVNETTGVMQVSPTSPGTGWRLATAAEIQMAVVPA